MPESSPECCYGTNSSGTNSTGNTKNMLSGKTSVAQKSESMLQNRFTSKRLLTVIRIWVKEQYSLGS